jgi:hypothetical protein
MKKLLTLAMVATLLMAGSAIAAPGGKLVRPNATFSFGVGGAAAGPTTTNNDDSCDIGVTPAATLLLPYFEVETATRAQSTFFTVTNVTDLPQIAHVTVWTDYSYPVLDFNIFLTGYDVQAIDLYDIIVNGLIAPTGPNTGGTSSLTTPGAISSSNDANPNIPVANLAACAALPGNIPPNLRADILSGLTVGTNSTCTGSAAAPRIGGNHGTLAIGYVTIDVSSRCSPTLPNTPSYYLNEILFDNVLIGDYQAINKSTTVGNFAGGNPLVHIRAIPEGGPAGPTSVLLGNQTNFPYTFYSRYINGQSVTGFGVLPLNLDRRQPLPATFAGRFIQGGVNAFNTNFKIWREGSQGPPTGACTVFLGSNANAASPTGATAGNSFMPITEIVRFDEHENPQTFSPGVIISPSVPANITLPETSAPASSSGTFPALASPAGDVGGWIYMNLNSGLVDWNGGTPAPAGTQVNLALHPNFPTPRPSQNWVVVSMTASGLYSVDFDAAWLGNGCTPAIASTNTNTSGLIGPAGGVPVCPQGSNPAVCQPGVAPYIGTNTTP